MKKKSIIVLFVVLLVACLAMTACGGGGGGTNEPEEVTLESWMADHPEEMEQVEVEEGMEVTFEKNTLVYTYDLSVLEGVDEATATSQTMIDALTEGLDGADSTFLGIIDDLEEETEIEGITIKVVYTFHDTVLVEKTYEK